MRPLVSKFKVYEESAQSNYWANVATENVLLSRNPYAKNVVDLTGPMMETISTAIPSITSGKTPLMDFLSKSGRVQKVDANTVKWKLKGTGKINPIAKFKTTNSATPGIRSTPFSIVLDADVYVESDILAPFIAKDCEVRVMQAPNGHAEGTEYVVQYINSNQNTYFPPELLEPGIQWVKTSSAVSEASSAYGSFLFSGLSWMEFESDLSRVAKRATVTDNGHELMLRIVSCGDDGNPIKDKAYPDKIITQIEAQFIVDNKLEKEHTLFYGRASGKNIIDSTSGLPIQRGSGLIEFLEDGNEFTYPRHGGSVEMFEEYLEGIFDDKVAYGSRDIVMYTGIGGFRLWNKWLAEKFAVSGVPLEFADATKSAGSWDSKNWNGFKINTLHPVETAFFPFGSLRVEHWPILDSRELNGGIVDPDSNLPLTSYEFYLLDYGMGNGINGNIELLERTHSQQVYTYYCGVWSPAGPINSGNSMQNGFTCAHPGAWYELLYKDTYGIRVKDVTKLAVFRPALAV